MSKRAIIAVDIQNEYFVTGKLPLVGIDAAAANAAKIIAHARDQGDLVIHIRHEMADPQAPVFTPRTSGVEINPVVAPLASETVIAKNYPNSFRDTTLRATLDGQGIADVVVIGAMSHMCIDATARAASDFGYKTTIVHDACATRDLAFGDTTVPAAQAHGTIMAALGMAYGEVIDTATLLAR